MKDKIVDLYETCGCLMATLILIFIVVLALAIVFGAFCFEGWIFMLLWNWLAVELFGATALGYWVCVGIVFALNFIGRLVVGRSGTVRFKCNDD